MHSFRLALVIVIGSGDLFCGGIRCLSRFQGPGPKGQSRSERIEQNDAWDRIVKSSDKVSSKAQSIEYSMLQVPADALCGAPPRAQR